MLDFHQVSEGDLGGAVRLDILGDKYRAADAGLTLPTLVLGFDEDHYRNDNSLKELNELVTSNRLGLRTTVLSNGYIGWSGHNLLTYSRDFANAVWTQTNGAHVGGLFTDDGLGGSGTVGIQRFSVVVPADTPTTYKARVKKDQLDWVAIETAGFDVAANGKTFFDLTLGAVGTTIAGHTAAITPDGDYYWISIEFKSVNTSGSVTVRCANSDGDAVVNRDGTSSFFIEKIHLYRSDLGGMQENDTAFPTYYPTEADEYYAPAFDHDSLTQEPLGLFTEPATTNLRTRSSEFTHADWNTDGSFVTGNVVTSPSDETTADLVYETAVSSLHRLTDFAGTDNIPMTISRFVKAAGRDKFSLFAFDSDDDTNFANVNFDLVAKTVITDVSGGNGVTHSATIKELIDNWFFITFSFTSNTAGLGGLVNMQMRLHNGAGDQSYLGDGVSGLYVWGAQLEARDDATSHVPTGNTTAARVADEVVMPPVVSGIELVTNGGFDTGISGWSPALSAVLSFSSGMLKVTTPNPQGFAAGIQGIATVIGRTYRATADLKSLSIDDAELLKSDSSLSHTNAVLTQSSVPKDGMTIDFVATATTSYIWLGATANNATVQIMEWDNVSVQELVPFVGFDYSQGTFVLRANWVEDGTLNYMVVGDTSSERFIYQDATLSAIKSHDGTATANKGSSFSDNTDIVVVQTYDTSGNLTILTDGGTPASVAHTGSFQTTTLGLGQLSVGNHMTGHIKSLAYFNVPLDLAAQQGFAA